MAEQPMVKAINEAMSQEPFVPFQLVMSSGDRFTIVNPGLISFLGLHMRYYFPTKDGHVDIQINHIAYLQVGCFIP
jgi:hypothetical protein